MNIQNALLRCTVLAATAVLPFLAKADEQAGYWYAGVGMGRTLNDAKKRDVINPGFAGLCTVFPCQVKDSDTGYKLFAGYQFTEMMGLEAEYTRLPNTFEVKSVDPTTTPVGIVRASQRSQTFSLRGVLTKHIYSSVSVSAVLGASAWNSDMDASIVGPGLSQLASEQSHGLSANFGFRINYDIDKRLRVRGAWDRYTNLGQASSAMIQRVGQPLVADTVHTDTDLFSIDLIYKFR